jgi:hypothetical protein
MKMLLQIQFRAGVHKFRVPGLFVSTGVRGNPRVYYSLLAYSTARFGRSDFGHQMPPRLPTRSAI